MNTSTVVSKKLQRGIDIHHHFLPPFYVEKLAKTGHPDADQAAALAWTPQKSLAMMDDTGIETAVLSLSLPGVYYNGNFAADTKRLARRVNEYAAGLVVENPGRFGAFATLPMMDAPAALSELVYALDNLKLDGVMLHSNVCGFYLGDPHFDLLLHELNQRRAIVFLHPNYPPGPGFNDFVEFPHDVARALASLTDSGAIERYPRIRYILAYGGGTIPFIAARVTVVGMDVFGSFLKTMIRYLLRARTMRRMNYDLTASTDPYAWRALYEHAKPGRILMGSNFPWTPPAVFARQQAKLHSYQELDLENIAAIERGNSINLIPRLA